MPVRLGLIRFDQVNSIDRVYSIEPSQFDLRVDSIEPGRFDSIEPSQFRVDSIEPSRFD